MTSTVQVRLDEKSIAGLEELRRAGLSTSEALREGIQAAVEKRRASKLPRLIGVGMFDSGLRDLSTNKKYMEGFGMTGPQKRALYAEQLHAEQLKAEQLKPGKRGKK